MTEDRDLLCAWTELQTRATSDYSFTLDSVLELCGGDGVSVRSSCGGLGHMAFVQERGVGFTIVMFLVVGREYRRAGGGLVTDVRPTFCLLGRTFEGILEVRAMPDLPTDLEQLCEQLRWARKTVVARGWDGE